MKKRSKIENSANLIALTLKNGGTWQSNNPSGMVTIRNHEGGLTFERAIFLLEDAKRQLWREDEGS